VGAMLEMRVAGADDTVTQRLDQTRREALVEPTRQRASRWRGAGVVVDLVYGSSGDATSVVAGARNHLPANRSLAFQFEVTA
jgi:hypothetical protein